MCHETSHGLPHSVWNNLHWGGYHSSEQRCEDLCVKRKEGMMSEWACSLNPELTLWSSFWTIRLQIKKIPEDALKSRTGFSAPNLFRCVSEYRIRWRFALMPWSILVNEVRLKYRRLLLMLEMRTSTEERGEGIPAGADPRFWLVLSRPGPQGTCATHGVWRGAYRDRIHLPECADHSSTVVLLTCVGRPWEQVPQHRCEAGQIKSKPETRRWHTLKERFQDYKNTIFCDSEDEKRIFGTVTVFHGPKKVRITYSGGSHVKRKTLTYSHSCGCFPGHLFEVQPSVFPYVTCNKYCEKCRFPMVPPILEVKHPWTPDFCVVKPRGNCPGHPKQTWQKERK